MPLTTGQILEERYLVEELLGQGGMGAVYRATDLRFNTPVALKENLGPTPEAQRQFSREAGLLHGLRHPNLPRVTDYFTIEGVGQYLVMDYVPGQNLSQILASHGAVPEGQAVSWIGQVLEALQYLHALNIIHRDVKPANVKITPEGQVVLVDFGLAKAYDPGQQTTVGARGVTPGYAPPEQYGYARTDARADIYSAGATLYALLTAQAPPEAMERVTRQAATTPLGAMGAAVSPGVAAAIAKAMEIAPADRFGSAAEFRKALLAAVAQPAAAHTDATLATFVGLGAGQGAGATVAETPAVPGGQARAGLDTVASDSAPLPPAWPAPAAGRAGMPPARARPADQHALAAGSTGRPAWSEASTPMPAQATAAYRQRRWPLWLGAAAGLAAIAIVAWLLLQGGPSRGAQATEMPTATQVTATEVAPTQPPAPSAVPTQPPAPTAVPTATPEATASPTSAPGPTAAPTPSRAELEQALLANVLWRQDNATPFFAYYTTHPPKLDGWVDTATEWTGARYPVKAIVFKQENWQGAADLSGRLSLSWDESNLYVGIQIRDDAHVQESSGSKLYEGDDVEIQIDADLHGDYAATKLSDDDGQLGLAVRDFASQAYESYVWRPPSLAGNAAVPMAAAKTADGYSLEAALPWSLLNLSPALETPYGFCLSLSDDDTPGTPAQESMVSTCPKRLLGNPGTWGTLVLVNW